MNLKMRTISMAVGIIFLSVLSVSAQTETSAPAAPQPEAELSQSKEIAIYGEVQSVDSEAGKLMVQYYDYDTDSEKIAELIIAPATKIENVSALANIKKGDWADVTYIMEDGKNNAKLVTVEVEEIPAGDDTNPAL